MTRSAADLDLARRIESRLPWLKAAIEANSIGEVRMGLHEAIRLLEEKAGRALLRVDEGDGG